MALPHTPWIASTSALGDSPSCELPYIPAPRPEEDDARVKATRDLRVLDTPPEERFDRIVRLAAAVFETPIAYVALVDSGRQWFKAKVGLAADQTPRATSFCGHAILREEALVVPDAREDPRFKGNPMVTGYPFLRFYAGHPLVSAGRKVGTLCLADLRPRALDARQIEILGLMAKMVEREFTLSHTLESQSAALEAAECAAKNQRELEQAVQRLESSKRRSDELLLNILPRRVAEELTASGSVQAVHYECASVMFADFSGFTTMSAQVCPRELVRELNLCFCRFDEIAARNGVEKLKTIGDGYVALAGILDHGPEAHLGLLRTAREIRDFVTDRAAGFRLRGAAYCDIRIGLHAGPLVTGVAGFRKFAYDAWGDTMNTAARIESAGAGGKINASRAFVDLIRDHAAIDPRGEVAIKGREPVEMYWIE